MFLGLKFVSSVLVIGLVHFVYKDIVDHQVMVGESAIVLSSGVEKKLCFKPSCSRKSNEGQALSNIHYFFQSTGSSKNWNATQLTSLSKNGTATQQQSSSLSDSEKEFGERDVKLYNHYKNVDVVRNYCTPELCLKVNCSDAAHHEKCLQRALSMINLKRLYSGLNLNLPRCWCRLDDTPIKVALVSLPGSGNTWARGLLEQATGFCTGSLWCDPGLRATQFCAEGLREARVVKNHDPTIRWRGEMPEKDKPVYDAAIFLHRNPYDALVAEHNRAVAMTLWEISVRKKYRSELDASSHIMAFGEEYFQENVYWDKRMRELMLQWEQMVEHLLIKSKGRPILLVNYEDLKKNPVFEVMRMVDFLGYDISENVVKERIARQQFSKFYRNHTQTFEPFTSAQMRFMNDTVSRVAAKLSSDQVLYLHRQH